MDRVIGLAAVGAICVLAAWPHIPGFISGLGALLP
jgi:hypothetical protein